jgi:2-succinyl-5-enolpyruvyl-6-hydroxy-3-cyclohexene-1-carboxylate synthase
MPAAPDTHLLLRAFVDELVRCGIREACTSPGSRSSPLVFALAREPRLRCFSHVDERCAGFFALGAAKAALRPVAITCTSGTAAANLAPAVIEAFQARVPLVVLTADRPPELREIGAGQTIDQIKLYGAAKWFFEVGTHDASPDRLRWMRTLACRAYWTALEGRPGAVHLNFPLREPLVTDEALPDDDTGRPDGRPYVSRPVTRLVAKSSDDALGKILAGAQRGVIVAGRHERNTPLGKVAAEFAHTAGWPLLADPLSGARRGPAAVAHYDALLREESFAKWAVPDLVLRVGDLPVSKPLRAWLAGLADAGVRQVALDPEGAWQDPASVLSDCLAVDPVQALTQATDALAPADEDWLSSWRSADELAAEAMLGVIAESDLSEPGVAAELGVLLPENATLFVASSMPVRDIETCWPVRPDPPRALCNRGANGIDGTVSSAFGVAGADGPVVLLIGDVALAHDIGGLLTARRTGLKLTIVLLDNGGGGIFDFLPVAQADTVEEQIYTTHVSTPTGLDFAQVANTFGFAHERAHDVTGFRAALERAMEREGSSIVEVHTARADNVELHRALWRSVSRALNPRSES